MATTTASSFLSLNWRDAGKGAILAILTPVITIITQSLNSGSLTFDWKAISITALSAFLAYLVKNFLTPASVTLQNVDKQTITAVKEGEAVAKIVPTTNQN
jgi:hypothetical protein